MNFHEQLSLLTIQIQILSLHLATSNFFSSRHRLSKHSFLRDFINHFNNHDSESPYTLIIINWISIHLDQRTLRSAYPSISIHFDQHTSRSSYTLTITHFGQHTLRSTHNRLPYFSIIILLYQRTPHSSFTSIIIQHDQRKRYVQVRLGSLHVWEAEAAPARCRKSRLVRHTVTRR